MWWRNMLLAVGVTATGIVGYGPGASSSEAMGNAEGDVVVLTLERNDTERQVFVLLDEPAEGATGDGRIDRVFRLQTDALRAAPFEEQLTKVKVNWTPRNVRVGIGGAEILLLGLDEDSATTGRRSISGWGFGHTKNWDITLPSGPLDASDYLRLRSLLTAAMDECKCSAGGAGATSCGIPTGGCSGSPSGCNVTCGSSSAPCCGCLTDSGSACCFCGNPE